MSENVTHTLYRFFDAEKKLLYVGRTIAPARRWREHERKKPWFNSVAMVTREVFATASEVDAAERAAIAAERPAYNVALNGGVRLAPPTPLQMATNTARVLADECDGEPEYCDCRSCHNVHVNKLEDLRAHYQWHPAVAANADTLGREYEQGCDISDWYYDLYDAFMFARLHLFEASTRRPLPAFAEFDGLVAEVDCSICGGRHRHVFSDGASLDTPITAPCDPRGLARYVLHPDWMEVQNLLHEWGDADMKAVAA